jgi:hypothetical protein
MTIRDLLLIWLSVGGLTVIVWTIGDLHNSIARHRANPFFALLHCVARLPMVTVAAAVAWPVFVFVLVKQATTQRESANQQVDGTR